MRCSHETEKFYRCVKIRIKLFALDTTIVTYTEGRGRDPRSCAVTTVMQS